MTDKQQVFTSPEVTLRFTSIKNARHNDKKDMLEYSTRSEVEASTPGAVEFKKKLEDINANLVVTTIKNKDGTKINLKDGNYIFNARSKDKPKVFDKQMNRIPDEEVPMLESGSKARLLLTTFEGKNGNGGGLNLAGVQLLDIIEYQGSEPIDEDTLVAALKATKK